METQRIEEADDLREQLAGKNELIAALVAELEQVVEQLDRVKRSGNDRGRSGAAGTAALPADVVEEHQQVLGEMQRVVQEWEAMQASSSLGRIESELAELRSLIANGIGRHAGYDPSSTESGSDSAGLDSVMSRLSLDNSSNSSSGAENSTAAWESMKRQMLGEPEPVIASPEEVENELTALLDSLSVPDPIDFETATVEALRQACADRDTYIVQITRWVRTRRTVSIPDNWEEMDTPDDLRQKVERLAARLEEQVRLAEVEMSLERARLSREKSQLQADRTTMDRHMKRLGITSLDELEDIAVSSSSTGDRRWMRFLGVNRKS
ncbi:MAG: hypothetical protein JSS49_05510 [Planctomycetes bacterium]|nr:hypothetical protein [Planctomycetota bacterium]